MIVADNITKQTVCWLVSARLIGQLDLRLMQCIAIDSCVSTRFAALLHAFFYNAWFFGAIYYWANWGFVLVFFLSMHGLTLRDGQVSSIMQSPSGRPCSRSGLPSNANLQERINEQKSNFDDDDDYKPFTAGWMKQGNTTTTA